MAVFNEPTKWAQTLGKDADVVVIPDTAGETDPSIDKIFPSVFSIPLANGGRAIPRSVLNGLFKLVGDWSFYQQNGGLASYSANFDYVRGRVVVYNNTLYKCIQANGASTTVKDPTDTNYWSAIPTVANIATSFANKDLSNLSATGQALFTSKADKDFTNIDNTAKIAIAHNAMPSSTEDALTLGTSGSTYTAPADGYFFLSKFSNSTNQYISLSNSGAGMHTLTEIPTAGDIITAWLPVKKGDVVTVNYSAGGNTIRFSFIYAVGSESEQ